MSDSMQKILAEMRIYYRGHRYTLGTLVNEWADRIEAHFTSAQATIDKLRAENEALRKDAERYEWLRRNARIDFTIDYEEISIHFSSEGIDEFTDIDEAIDAALNQREPGK